MVRRLRRHAAFIVCYTGRTLPQAETGTSRHEDTNVGNQRSLFRRRGLRLPLVRPRLPLTPRGALVAAP